jgi:hypothetical protein
MITDTDYRKIRSVAERIAEGWGLNDDEIQQLLGDDLERISCVLGIYKALRTIFPFEDRANAWPAKPNAAFGGESALSVMLDGGLAEVGLYLDGQC